MSAIFRRHLRLAVAIGAGMMLAGCLSTLPGGEAEAPASPAPATAASPVNAIGTGRVKIGLVLPLSGQGQGAVAGVALRNAADLALSEFQDADIQLLVHDDQGTADGARAATQAALGEGADLIIGPLLAPAVQGAAGPARAAGKPIIAFSTDASVATRGVYLLSFLIENEVDRVVAHAYAQGRRAFAALIPEGPYGRVAESAFQKAVSSKGARLVAVERYAGGDKTALQAAAQRLAPSAAQSDALFLPETAANLPAVAAALQAAGIDTAKAKPLGTGIWNERAAFAVPALNGGWFAAPDPAGYDAFAQRYKARFGSDPTRIAALGYDAVSLAAALTRTQGAQRFSEATLTNAKGFSGVDGVFRFRPNGLNERGLAVFEIGNGTVAAVSPAPPNFAGGT